MNLKNSCFMDLTTFIMHLQIENLACTNKWTNWNQKTCEINIWWRWWFNSRWSRRRTWDSNQTQNSIRFRFDFSIKLTDSLDSDLSPDSDWDNNYCSVNFWQSWASLQNDHHFHLKRQLFLPWQFWKKIVVALWIFSAWLMTQIWVKWVSQFYRKIWPE